MNTERLRKQLKRDEGVRESAYQDSEGYWTIGVGHLIDPAKGGKLSRGEIEYILSNDIDRAVYRLDHEYDWYSDLNDVRQEVVVNMVFNLGIKGFGRFVNTIDAIVRGDWLDASREMLDSKWASQVGERAIRLAHAMRTGQWGV